MTGIASAIVGWNTLVDQGSLPDWAPLLHVSNLPFSLAAPALSFLLVFRTNASYGRFDEVGFPVLEVHTLLVLTAGRL